MIDIAYVLGEHNKSRHLGSQWDNKELLFSLRSLDTYALDKNIRIIIIGPKPSFLSEQVHEHYIPDLHRSTEFRYLNVLNKVFSWSCESEFFVLMNDDFFLTSHISLETLPLFFDSTLDSYIKKKRGNHRKILRNTHKILTSKGISDPKSFAVHFPMPIISKKFNDIVAPYKDISHSFRTLYGNLERSINHVEKKDYKITTSIQKVDKFKEKAKNVGMFSIDDAFLDNKGVKVLEELFPNKSRWEI